MARLRELSPGHHIAGNPSNAGSVLFTTVGRSALPDRFTQALDRDTRFRHTEYTFSRLVEVCEQLARQAVERAGGRIERDADGQEVFAIPVADPRPGPYAPSWTPGAIADRHFSEQELWQIEAGLRGAP